MVRAGQRLSVQRIGARLLVRQPIDAGPTAQRYAEREPRVKLTPTRLRPVSNLAP